MILNSMKNKKSNKFHLISILFVMTSVLGGASSVIAAEPTAVENKTTPVNKVESGNAETTESTQNPKPVAPVQPLTEAEVQKALNDMRIKILKDLEIWSNQLKRSDFNRQGGQLSLKPAKQQEMCQIFQKTIDETYLLAKKNRHRMNPEEQAIVDNRSRFLQTLGFKNNTIPTKLGFDCHIH